MEELFEIPKVKEYADFLRDQFGVSPIVLLNTLISILILVFLIWGRELLTRKFLQKIKNERFREFLQSSIPPLLRVFGIVVLIKTWLTGPTSLTALLQLKVSLVEQIAETVYVFLFYNAAKKVGNSFIHFNNFDDVQKEYSFGRTLHICLATLAGIFLFRIWIATQADLSTYLGLLSAGIAIALRDVIVSAAGWVYLVVVKPFSVGDRIEIDGKLGDVIDIQPLQFSVLELGNWARSGLSTGRVMHFPNHFILNNVITNHNEAFNFVWVELPILITFESNWQKAYELLDELLDKSVGRNNLQAQREIRMASRQFKLYFNHLDSKVWVSVADSGVNLTLRFLCNPKEKVGMESKLWKEILEIFSNQADIDFAYPTQRTFVNFIEADDALQPGQGT